MLHVDFHTHTTISDGVWTPEQLFDFIRSRDFAFFSVTDHDTMDVYPIPSDLRTKCIPGMEVDTKCEGMTAHLLCYGITSPDAPLLQHLSAQREARKTRMLEMVDQLKRHGIAITMDDVQRQAGDAAALGRPHLARALVKLGHVSTVQEAFDRYLSDDAAAYVSLERLTSAHAISLAHQSGALVSVAHPKRLKEPRLLDVLREAGADAVEVVHPTADAEYRAELESYARRHGMLVTAGSDFHAPALHPEPGVDYSADVIERFVTAVKAQSATV